MSSVDDLASLIEQFKNMKVSSEPGYVAVHPTKTGDYTTLRLGLSHYVSEANKYRIRETTFNKVDALSAALLRIQRFLKAAEVQLGPTNIKSVTPSFFDIVLEDTPLHYLAQEDLTWTDIIQEIRSLYQIPAEDHYQYFDECLKIAPTEKVSIKSALIQVISVHARASLDQVVSILPPVAVVCRNITEWFPPTSVALIPDAITNVVTTSQWSDIIPAIKELARTCPVALRSTKASKPISSSTSTPNNPRNTTGTHSEISKKVPVSESNKPQQSNNPTKPAAVENSAAKANNFSRPHPTVKPTNIKSIGRLRREDDQNVATFRIDNGADSHVCGRDLIPFVRNRKPATDSYSVFMQSRPLRPEQGVLDLTILDVDDIPHEISINCVLNPSNTLSVLSTGTSSTVNGHGTFELPELPKTKFPCRAKENFPFAEAIVRGDGKNVSKFLRHLGFTSSPVPAMSVIAQACHLKFGCAGVDSLYDTSAILGFPIPRNICYTVCQSCPMCPNKLFHGPIDTINSSPAAVIPSELKDTDPPPRQPIMAPSNYSISNSRAGFFKPVNNTPKAGMSKEANELNDFLFIDDELEPHMVGSFTATEDQDVLVFDHLVHKSSYVMVVKLEARGMIFLEFSTKKSMSQLPITIMKRFNSTVRSLVCDHAAEFSHIQKEALACGKEFNPSHLARPAVKGRQESAVRLARAAINWVMRRFERLFPEARHNLQLCLPTAEFILNTRASPSRKAIPWFITYNERPRLDLHTLAPVYVIKDSNIAFDNSKAVVGIYLGQKDPQTGIYWCFKEKKLELREAHISKFRQNRMSCQEYVETRHEDLTEQVFEPVLSIGALSSNTRPLCKADKLSDEWREAIMAHATKLIGCNAFSTPTNYPSQFGHSFFTGRVVDDKLKARLVSNGSLHSDTPVDSYLPLIHERYLFLTLLTQKRSQGWCVCSGDVESAYYHIPGSGFMKLPYNWPIKVGDFSPNQVVQLNCAIPGDTLSSGLFLERFANTLTAGGYPQITGCIHGNEEAILINFSDDCLAVCRSEEARARLETTIRTVFPIKLEALIPDRWVSLEMSFQEDTLQVTTSRTAANYDVSRIKYKLKNYDQLQTEVKTEDAAALKEARTWVGRVGYLATSNPFLRFPHSLLSSAVFYDPEACTAISQSLIYTYVHNPFRLTFKPIVPQVVAIYSDASHSLKNFRAYSGCWIQLQSTDAYEPMSNVLSWNNERLAALYDSVYSAELKAAVNSLLHWLSIRSSVFSVYGNLDCVLFMDNKAAVNTVNSVKETHPFSAGFVDFIRQVLTEQAIVCKWVPSEHNHADILTKPKKW